MAVAIPRGAPPPSVSLVHKPDFGFDQPGIQWRSSHKSPRPSRAPFPQQQRHSRYHSTCSLPSPPQQPEPTFPPSTSAYEKAPSSYGTPLSPPVSDGFMSPPTQGQELSDRATNTNDMSGMLFPSSYGSSEKPLTASMRLPVQGAPSPPPVFIEDILRDMQPTVQHPISQPYMDEKGFEISNMQAMQSAPLKRDYSDFLLPSPYGDQPQHHSNTTPDQHYHHDRFNPLGASSSHQQRRKRRRLTNLSEANFRCDQCGKLFSRIWNYNAHLDTHNPDRPRPHVCPEKDCRKSFVRRTDLTRHTSCVHTKDKKFKCKLCSNVFARKDTLRRHEEDGCPKRVDIVSRHAKNKPLVVQSQALNFYLSQREAEQQHQQHQQQIYYNPYEDQQRAQHCDQTPSGLPRISEMVPILKIGW